MSESGIAKKIVAISMALLLVTCPLMSQQSSDEFVKGRIDGEQDAKAEGIWILAGCALGVTGILLAYLVEPSVPAGQLVGKSSAYVMGYTDGYKSKTKSLNAKQAITGCVISSVAWVTLYVVLLTSAEASTY